jgi:hypothetical protein
VLIDFFLGRPSLFGAWQWLAEGGRNPVGHRGIRASLRGIGPERLVMRGVPHARVTIGQGCLELAHLFFTPVSLTLPVTFTMKDRLRM